jgi:hypothetical protein
MLLFAWSVFGTVLLVGDVGSRLGRRVRAGGNTVHPGWKRAGTVRSQLSRPIECPRSDRCRAGASNPTLRRRAGDRWPRLSLRHQVADDRRFRRERRGEEFSFEGDDRLGACAPVERYGSGRQEDAVTSVDRSESKVRDRCRGDDSLAGETHRRLTSMPAENRTRARHMPPRGHTSRWTRPGS